eukprot:452424_1
MMSLSLNNYQHSNLTSYTTKSYLNENDTADKTTHTNSTIPLTKVNRSNGHANSISLKWYLEQTQNNFIHDSLQIVLVFLYGNYVDISYGKFEESLFPILPTQSIPHLNDNEFADKTAPHYINHNKPTNIKEHSIVINFGMISQIQTSNTPSGLIKNLIKEAVDQPPGQLISLNIIVIISPLNIIVIIGFAVDQPPGQLTPLNIIVIIGFAVDQPP